MKQKLLKRVTAVLSALVMGLVLIGGTPLTAKASDSITDTMVQEIVSQNEKYREMLNDEVWGPECNGPAYRFGLVDVNGDGFEELIVKSVNPDQMEWKSADEFLALKNGEVDFWLSSYLLASLYYCEETGCVMMMENFEPNSDEPSNGNGFIRIYGYDEAGEMKELFGVSITAGVYEECTEVEVNAKINEYMPEKVLLEAPYEITEENLNAYLPIDENVVHKKLEESLAKEVTTNAITLKVGEAFGVSYDNVDKLLDEAGYDYQGNRNITPYIFYDDRVEMDAEYFARTCGVGVYNEDTQEILDVLYVADDEWTEVLEKEESGVYAKEYGVNVLLVEEAEGFCYYARADKEGTATITIPEYPVASGETITVHIPVIIQAVSQEGGNDTTIESTTDNSIVIDNSNSVLPAGTVLQSAKLESGDVYNNAEKIVKENVDTLVKYAVYELNLTDGSGAEIHQLNGKVSVTMDIPFTMSENTVLKVYRVDNGTLVNCPATVSNGKVTFETDHFSTYIFAEETQTVVTPPSNPEQPPVTAPQTGDNSSIVTLVLLMVAGISLCGVAVFGKKYKITE